VSLIGRRQGVWPWSRSKVEMTLDVTGKAVKDEDGEHWKRLLTEIIVSPPLGSFKKRFDVHVPGIG